MSNNGAAPPSVYQTDAIPPLPTPPLDQNRRVSVAIVGAGIAGLSTALHLAEAGVDPIVVDAQEVGWGASGNNGGQLNPGLKYDRGDRGDRGDLWPGPGPSHGPFRL